MGINIIIYLNQVLDRVIEQVLTERQLFSKVINDYLLCVLTLSLLVDDDDTEETFAQNRICYIIVGEVVESISSNFDCFDLIYDERIYLCKPVHRLRPRLLVSSCTSYYLYLKLFDKNQTINLSFTSPPRRDLV